MIILDLNAYCLDHICSFLDLENQMYLKNVSKTFQEIVKTFWHRRGSVITLDEDYFEKSDDINKDFLDLMSCVSDRLEELHLNRIDIEQFRLLEGMNFPKMRYLEYTIKYNDHNSHDENNKLIAKIFPKLSRLKLLSSTTGKYICDMEHLVDLDLGSCEDLVTDELRYILTSLPLKSFKLLYYGYNTNLGEDFSSVTSCSTLEELQLDDHHLCVCLNEGGLLTMPNLRKLITYTRDYDDYFMSEVAKNISTRVHTLIYSGVFWSRDNHLEQLIKLKNLEKLVMFDDDATSLQLAAIGDHLSALKEFYFIKSHVKEDDGLLNIIKHCGLLRIMDLTKTSLSPEFLQKAINIVNKTKRSVPLELRCAETEIADYCVEDLPKALVLTKTISNLDLPYTRCIQVEWLPQAG